MRSGRIGGLMLAALLAGCYRYVAIQPDSAPVGSDVRAHLSTAGISRLREVLPRADRYVDGKILQRSDSGLLLSIPVSAGREVGERELSQRIDIPRNDLMALEFRELDRVRTVALIGGVGAGTLALLVRALSGRTESTAETGGGGPPDIMVPIVVVPLHR